MRAVATYAAIGISLRRATIVGNPYPRGYAAAMTLTRRAYGAQSMTADLREVLVSRPGAAFGRAFDMPWCGFLRPCDLDRAQLEHDGLVSALDGLGVTVHALPEPDGNDDPDLAYVFDPLLISDRGAIPLRPGKANRAGEPPVLEVVDAGRRDPDRRPDRGRRARSRVATRSGCGRTCCASGSRSGRTTRALASWPRSSAATSGSSTSRTGAGRRSWSICCRSCRRSPMISRSSTCRCCRSGCGR